MTCGQVLTRDQQLKLQTAVTKEEINQALKDINDLKAPEEMDSTLFSKKAWTSIDDEVRTLYHVFGNSNCQCVHLE